RSCSGICNNCLHLLHSIIFPGNFVIGLIIVLHFGHNNLKSLSLFMVESLLECPEEFRLICDDSEDSTITMSLIETKIIAEHFGHLIFVPVKESGGLSLAPHWQTIVMDIKIPLVFI
ncbi:MAG: hypothetical protein NT142_14635, partial [Planctomycetota bacterium]|nr:hypothetical protein [Planctomycetota bacterium]